jgi:hypothetical protein
MRANGYILNLPSSSVLLLLLYFFENILLLVNMAQVGESLKGHIWTTFDNDTLGLRLKRS